VLLLAAATPLHAASRALVIGIDQYDNLPDLAGAVNDATDIASTLHAAGFEEVVTLLDGQASRMAILDSWTQIVKRSAAGDTIVFSYAGHGGQEPERVAGDETDGLNEVFLLPGFREEAPGNFDRILDDELYGLFKAADAFNIVFVADSCHSGTMTRSFDARAGTGRSRLAGYGPITDDELPPPAAPAAGPVEDNLEHVTFFGAVEDHQVVLEVAIEGRPRGAMSWAFARAMRGAADRNANRRLDTAELESYLRETVRTATEGRQLPRMLPRGRPLKELVTIAAASPPADEEPIRVFGLTEAEQLEGAVTVASAAEADLVWDPASREVVSAAGDIVATLDKNHRKLLQQVVDKWHVLRKAREMAERDPLRASLAPGFGRHRAGDRIEITFADARHTNLVLLNLANDGTVQLIAPGPDPNDIRYNGRISPGQPVKLPVEVVPPFGTDHVLALVSADPAAQLIDLVRQRDGMPADAALASALSELSRAGSVQTAVASIVTGFE
jgi:hypothetical protein